MATILQQIDVKNVPPTGIRTNDLLNTDASHNH